MQISDEFPGEYVARDDSGQILGALCVNDDGEITDVYVQPPHRRKGIATALLRHAQALYPEPVHHSPMRTIDGQAWATAVGGDLPPWIGC